MNFKFDKITNEFLKIITKNAQKQSIRVFFVGGIVRDNVLNLPTKDIDILLTSNAIEFSMTLPQEIKILSVHKEFCTVRLLYKGLVVDVASSRCETYPYSGSLPKVFDIGVDINKDCKRRDFTINSMYCELQLVDDNLDFKFIDLLDSMHDIKSKQLKVLHDKSYIDDPTRILRGLDFKYRFGFQFSSHDIELILNYLNNINYFEMSISRNKKVLEKVLNTNYQDKIFQDLILYKIYKIFYSREINIDFSKLSVIFNIFKLDIVQKKDFYIKLLFSDSAQKYQVNSILELYKIFKKLNKIELAFYLYSTNDKNVMKFLSIQDINLMVTGQDLINIGYRQGKNIGLILDSLLLEKLNSPEKFICKNSELDWVKNHFHEN